MMTQVLSAIKAQFQGNAVLKGLLTGGLYFQQAPQTASSPYGVYYYMGSTQDEFMGGADDNIKEIEIQFNLFDDYDDGGVRLAGIMEKLRQAFDWQTIKIDDYQCLKVEPISEFGVRMIDDIWQATINYNFGLIKE